MDPEQIKALVRQEVQKNANAKRFGQQALPRHIHNGVDSPPVFNPTRIYTGHVPASGIISEAEPILFPKGWSLSLEAGTVYKITHNLGTELYSLMVVQTNTPIQQVFPATSVLTTDYAEIYWLTPGFLVTAANFAFCITVANNKDALPPQYISN